MIVDKKKLSAVFFKLYRTFLKTKFWLKIKKALGSLLKKLPTEGW